VPILSYKRNIERCADMGQKLVQADYITTVKKFLGANDLIQFTIILAKKRVDNGGIYVYSFRQKCIHYFQQITRELY